MRRGQKRPSEVLVMSECHERVKYGNFGDVGMGWDEVTKFIGVTRFEFEAISLQGATSLTLHILILSPSPLYAGATRCTR